MLGLYDIILVGVRLLVSYDVLETSAFVGRYGIDVLQKEFCVFVYTTPHRTSWL